MTPPWLGTAPAANEAMPQGTRTGGKKKGGNRENSAEVDVLEFQGAAAREHDIGVGVAKSLLEWGVAEQRRHVVGPLGEPSVGAESWRRVGDRSW